MDRTPKRPPLAVAMQWATHVTSIAMEMALPGLAGLWLDRQLGTGFAFLIVGTVLGFSAGMLHLLRLTRPDDR